VTSNSPKTSPTRTSPPPRMEHTDIIRANLPHTSRSLDHESGDTSPGSWSTAATPGTPGVPTISEEDLQVDVQNEKDKGKAKGASSLRQVWVSEEMEEQDPSSESSANNGFSLFPPSKSVTFSSSVIGGESSPPSPGIVNMPSFEPHMEQNHGEIPPGLIPRHIHPLMQPDLPGQTISPFSLSPHLLPEGGTPPVLPVVPPVPTHPSHPNSSGLFQSEALVVPQVAPPNEVELTPTLIAKAQKHCRFAISALDYEDAAHAKKELKTALALLGG
jgi:vacuolar protein sorting-associated protein VTA1